MFYKAEDVRELFNILNAHNINYILTKNISDELPDKLKIGKDIDLIIHPNDYDKFKTLLADFGYRKITHPHGKEVGWIFMYGAHENIFLRHATNSLIVDAYAELCTKSIVMNAWLPLDRIIQESVWADKVWDAENQWWIMDDENMIIYLITRSVFEKNKFTEAYIREIDKRMRFLVSPDARRKLEKVFFKFTNTLLKMVSKGKYKEILTAYLMFTDY